MRKIIITIISILLFISLVLSGIGFYVSLSKKEVVVDNNKYVGFYGIKKTIKRYSSGDANEYLDVLYLRNDGTFFMSIEGYLANEFSTGTYSYSDKGITLTETARYANNDSCYYTDDLESYEVNLVNDELQLTYNNEEYTFEKNLGNSESEANKSYYTAHPEDGKSGEGIGTNWKKCTH